MYPPIKISHHRYTGRYLPHEHTSYFGLGFLSILCTIILASVTFQAAAYTYGDPNPGPYAGSVGLSGTVTAPPPSTAAVITSPSNGQHFSATPITVSGTCPANTLIELYKNDIFAGATDCQDNKTFKVDIDLLYGSNSLVARDYDALDQVGPDSNSPTVFYDALPAQGLPIDTSNLNNLQLLLSSTAVYRGIFPQQEFQLPIDIVNGTPPFALSIDWGDNKSDLISRPSNVGTDATHTYARPGVYQVNIKASDAAGRVAFLTVVVIVNGPVEVLTSNTTTNGATTARNTLAIAWPLLILVFAMIGSYWYGERRELHKLKSTGVA